MNIEDCIIKSKEWLCELNNQGVDSDIISLIEDM